MIVISLIWQYYVLQGPNSILVAMVMLLNIGLAIIFVHFLTWSPVSQVSNVYLITSWLCTSESCLQLFLGHAGFKWTCLWIIQLLLYLSVKMKLFWLLSEAMATDSAASPAFEKSKRRQPTQGGIRRCSGISVAQELWGNQPPVTLSRAKHSPLSPC